MYISQVHLLLFFGMAGFIIVVVMVGSINESFALSDNPTNPACVCKRWWWEMREEA